MILHVDMDAFYASVEERDRPELAGKPIVVGGTPDGRGVVAAANYVVREFGVHSAMPAAAARRLCPQAVFLPPRISHYAEISEQIRAVFEQYTPLVEPLSLDEAFLDVTGSIELHGDPVDIAKRIKREIHQQLKLVASVGVAPNKFLAKVASDLEKPDGLVVVDPGGIPEFLDVLPVGRIWGVGRVTGKVFQRLGVRTIGQLRQMPAESLRHHFGTHGDHLLQLACGIDSRRVIPEHEAKSISHETTFARDLQDREVMRAWLLELSQQVACRLRKRDLKGRTIHLKLRFDDFTTITRSQTLPNPTHETQEIWETVAMMLEQRLPARTLSVRLLGVGVSGLTGAAAVQLSLFEEEDRQRQSRLDEVADSIRGKFGSGSLQRGSGLLRDDEQRPYG